VNERFRRPAFIALEVVLLLAIPVLAVKGFGAVLDTTEGRSVDPELDAVDPGFEAFLEPTPVQVVIGVDDAGELSWIDVLALGGAGGQGGALVFVPTATVAPADEVEGYPSEPLAQRFTRGGPLVVQQAVADVLTVAIDEIVVLEPPRMAALLAPVEPLTVDNPDDIDDFDAGELSLTGEEVASLLVARDPDESDLSRLARHEAVWRAWFTAIAASTDPDVVPGEQTSGIGQFVRGLAAGPTTFDVPPGVEELSEAFVSVVYTTDPAAVADFAEERIPFPAAARPGDRLRVRVLDGVGADGLTLALAREVVRAGGQVVVVGNGDNFESTETRLVYFDGALTEVVEAMGDELGVTVEQLEGLNPDDGVDATLVAGSDALATYGLAPRG
jgi:hypothetical protein